MVGLRYLFSLGTPRSRHPIVWSFPLTFYFHAALRSRMTETMIGFGQRGLTLLGQHSHLDRSIFVGRSVGYRIRVAASKAIDGTFRRIHWHIKLISLHSIRHQRADTNPTVSRGQFYPASSLDP